MVIYYIIFSKNIEVIYINFYYLYRSCFLNFIFLAALRGATERAANMDGWNEAPYNG